MSFEGMFEKWLKTQDEAEDSKDKRGGELEQQLQIAHPAGEIKRVEDEASVPQDALASKLIKHAPVSSAVNISSKQLGRQIQSTSLYSVQISHSDKDVEDGQTRDFVTPPYHNDKIKGCLEETNEINKHAIASMVDNKHMKQNMPVEGQDHRQCHTHSVLTALKDATPTTSPAGVEVLRVDPVLSPEHDSLMEPDSTSECLAAGKSISTRKQCEIMHKVYQGRGDSPCSTGGEANNTGIKPSAVTVHVEESQAECDSTCMYLASPNAISPASQGEIEERVCPFLTDHEDGASPSHCVCQCRSLPPPVKLLTGDHVPTITTATSASPPSHSSPHLTVRIVSTKTDGSSSEIISKTPLISSKGHYECRTNSDLEQFATKLELRRKKTEEKPQIETVVATLPGKEVGEQYLSEYAETDSAASATPSEVKDFPIIKGLLEHSKDETGTSRHERSSSSGKLDVSVKCDPKQNEVCDFAKHIDWDTAVAETFESSTSVRGYDGESKPGIILKIRAKAVVPCLEKNLEPKSVKSASSGKRKGESLGSPEILSRLRKRQKSEVDTSGTPCSSEEANSEQQCKAKSRQLTSSTGSGDSCRNSSTSKRTRRNTVHLDGDLKAYTRHLSPSDCKFVESTTRLSRLQTLTYDLVYSLFPLLRQQLNRITPESHHFTEITDDIISSLECSDSEEIVKDFECLHEQFEKLKVREADLVPIYSPQVVLCSDPLHSLEDFQHRVCSLLQLLLPDLTMSLSDCFLRSPGQLEEVLRRVLSANKIKDKGARKCRFMSL